MRSQFRPIGTAPATRKFSRISSARSLLSKRTLASVATPATRNGKFPFKPKINIIRKKFIPAEIEASWYGYWESCGFFEPPPKTGPGKEIRMLLPPPNITGQLHVGHALMLSMQDALARWYRMNGRKVYWAPGTDHAGIATQSVVEKMLAAKGVTKEMLGREAFLQEMEKWREQYGSTILDQMERLGVSTAKSLEYYTMDEGLSTAVTNAFVELHKKGLVYRDTRMVNWSTQLRTAVSDIEVEWKEIEGKTKIGNVEFGVLHSFAFKLEDGSGEIVVSTTRPETIPGDRAIAVHPEDERYKHLHYKFAIHPLVSDAKVQIIPDAELVDPEFGTGAVKITPCHDPHDFAFWRRHTSPNSPKRVDIPLISVFYSSGEITPEAGIPEITGKDRLEARGIVVELLKQCGAYRKGEDHAMRIGTCERSGSFIEPIIRPQWYLKMEQLAEKALSNSVSMGLKIRPVAPYTKLWKQWLEGIQDWCLSRQIWWGHRVPAYQVVNPSSKTLGRWIVAASEEEALDEMTAEEKEIGCKLEQDPDVLDTWFSSGLLPLSTAGWRGGPIDGSEVKYPLTFIESGSDILFFWLARMAMLCNYFSGKLPFKEIIIHPLVCDSAGRKMSKSVGNVLDPLAIIEGRKWEDLVNSFKRERKHDLRESKSVPEKHKIVEKEVKRKIDEAKKVYREGIPQSGADALRMALVDYTKQSGRITMELRHVTSFLRLNMKIWNASKHLYLAKTNAEKETGEPITILPLRDVIPRKDFAQLTDKYLSLHDWFMIHRLRALIETCDEAFETRQLYKATEAIRAFFFNDFCDVFLEFQRNNMAVDSDPERRQRAISLTSHSLDIFLRLAHPFAPFLTEGIWQQLDPTRQETDGNTIMFAPYPKAVDLPKVEPTLVTPMGLILALLFKLRNLAATTIERQTAAIYISPRQPALARYVKEKLGILRNLTSLNLDEISGMEEIQDIQEVPAGEGEDPEVAWGVYKQTLAEGRVRTVFKYRDPRETARNPLLPSHKGVKY